MLERWKAKQQQQPPPPQQQQQTFRGFCKGANWPLVHVGSTSCSLGASLGNTTVQNGGKVLGEGWRGWFHTCCSILERGAQAKLAAQMANVYNGIESCPA